jgi:hypothetical protein
MKVSDTDLLKTLDQVGLMKQKDKKSKKLLTRNEKEAWYCPSNHGKSEIDFA